MGGTDKPSWASQSERITSKEAAKSEIKRSWTQNPNKERLGEFKQRTIYGRSHTESKQRKIIWFSKSAGEQRKWFSTLIRHILTLCSYFDLIQSTAAHPDVKT